MTGPHDLLAARSRLYRDAAIVSGLAAIVCLTLGYAFWFPFGRPGFTNVALPADVSMFWERTIGPTQMSTSIGRTATETGTDLRAILFTVFDIVTVGAVIYSLYRRRFYWLPAIIAPVLLADLADTHFIRVNGLYYIPQAEASPLNLARIDARRARPAADRPDTGFTLAEAAADGKVTGAELARVHGQIPHSLVVDPTDPFDPRRADSVVIYSPAPGAGDPCILDAHLHYVRAQIAYMHGDSRVLRRELEAIKGRDVLATPVLTWRVAVMRDWLQRVDGPLTATAWVPAPDYGFLGPWQQRMIGWLGATAGPLALFAAAILAALAGIVRRRGARLAQLAGLRGRAA